MYPFVYVCVTQQYTWIVDSAVTKADLQAWAESVE